MAEVRILMEYEEEGRKMTRAFEGNLHDIRYGLSESVCVFPRATECLAKTIITHDEFDKTGRDGTEEDDLWETLVSAARRYEEWWDKHDKEMMESVEQARKAGIIGRRLD